MTKIEFTKMHGIGNDYIYVNCMEKELSNPPQLSRLMSPRHFSVGADGLVLICASKICDAKMRMFNADGSEGKMCGNAIRCVGKYLYENNICKKESISIETLSGIKQLQLEIEKEKVKSVSVDMGFAVFEPRQIPLLREKEMINEPVSVNGGEYNITAVSMGNPHAVICVEAPDELKLEKIGPAFENLPLFPERVNTEFIRVSGKNEIEMRVWERGSGETWACGTGACAVVAACVKNGLCSANEPVRVKLKGGELEIICASDYRITMKGPAAKAYEGVFCYESEA